MTASVYCQIYFIMSSYLLHAMSFMITKKLLWCRYPFSVGIRGTAALFSELGSSSTNFRNDLKEQ